MTNYDLTNRVVIVTGASSGIGEATARALHSAGAHPVLAARRQDRLDVLSAELNDALAVPSDVTDASDVSALIDATMSRYGRIDGLINNAGVSLNEAMDIVNLDEFSRVLDLNVIALVRMTQAVLPAMRAGGSGRIVNISSGTTNLVLPGVGAYAATKSAVNMISAVTRAELADENIVVSLVLPSMTATEFGGGQFKLGEEPRPGVPVQSAESVAEAILEVLRTGAERSTLVHD